MPHLTTLLNHGASRPATACQSTSPPMTSSRASTGTKLPYPTGDYASPAQTSIAGSFSPTNSPPSSVTKSARPTSMNITGLPPPASQQNPPMSSSSSSYSMASFSSTSSILPQTAPVLNNNGMTSPSSSPAAGRPSKALPVPPHKTSSSSLRQNSASPTPRKRYTVALGGPLVPPEDWEEQQQQQQQTNQRPMTPRSGRQRYTASPANDMERDDNDDEEDEFQDETIGKSKATKVSSGLRSNGNGNENSLPTPPRVRAQSAYGLSSIQAQSPHTMAGLGGDLPSVAPLRPRVRSKSTDRLDAGGSKFVDPLVLRKQESAAKLAMPKPIGKVPVGQLVAFFDQERK